MLWKLSFALALTSGLCACNTQQGEAPLDASDASRSGDQEQGTLGNETGYRILAAGRTNIYLPLSWLRCMKMLPTAVVAKGTSNDPKAGYIAPSFQDHESPGIVHHIIRNPEMLAQGIGFRLDGCIAPGQLEGVPQPSTVYEIAFAHRPKVVTANLSHRKRLMSLQPEHGWVLLNGTYYDVSRRIASDTDAYAVPVATGSGIGSPDMGQFRYDDDLVISYWWRVRSREFDGPKARADRERTRALVDWLTSDPERRDPRRTGS